MSTPSCRIDLESQTFGFLVETRTFPLGLTSDHYLCPPTPFAQNYQHTPLVNLFPSAAPSPPDAPGTPASSPITTTLPTCPICLDSPIKMIYPCRHATCLNRALEIWYTGAIGENIATREFSCPMCRGLVCRMRVVLGVWGGGEEGGEEVVGVEGGNVAIGGWKSVHRWVGETVIPRTN